MRLPRAADGVIAASSAGQTRLNLFQRERNNALVAPVPYLLLGIGPAGDLDNHVQDCLLLVRVQRNVVEGRDGHAILLEVDTMLERVGRRDSAQLELGHVGREVRFAREVSSNLTSSFGGLSGGNCEG